MAKIKEFSIKTIGAPMDEIRYLIGVLTKREALDKVRAVKAGYKLIGYLLDNFLGTVTTQAILAKKSPKATIAALEALVAPGVQAKAVPIWLVPTLLQLIQLWLSKK